MITPYYIFNIAIFFLLFLISGTKVIFFILILQSQSWNIRLISFNKKNVSYERIRAQQ